MLRSLFTLRRNRHCNARLYTSYTSAQGPRTNGCPSASCSTTEAAKTTLQPVQNIVSFATAKRPVPHVNTTSAFWSTKSRVSSLIDAPHELESPANDFWPSVRSSAKKNRSCYSRRSRDYWTGTVGEAHAALSVSCRGQGSASLSPNEKKLTTHTRALIGAGRVDSIFRLIRKVCLNRVSLAIEQYSMPTSPTIKSFYSNIYPPTARSTREDHGWLLL